MPPHPDRYAKGWEAALVYVRHLLTITDDIEEARGMIGVQIVEARKKRTGSHIYQREDANR